MKMIVSRSIYVLACVSFGSTFAMAQFSQHNLVSDGSVAADHIDTNLINPWGVAASAAGPFWVSNQGSANSTLYNSLGVPQALVVATTLNPTGQVFNGTAGFNVTSGGNTGSAKFIFATLGGKITGWASGVNPTTAIVAADRSATGAVYTGLALVGSQLFAANASKGVVDVFNDSFGYVSSFTDPTVPSGFNPFGIKNIGGQVWVTYSQRNNPNGFVDVFNPDGTLVRRFTQGGPLFEPWGMVKAPSSFGALGGQILIGNKYDGKINAYDSVTGNFITVLKDGSGNPIVNTGLWELLNGNGGNGGDPNSIYFAAGIGGEVHGLFGRIDAVPEPLSLLPLGIGALIFARRRKVA